MDNEATTISFSESGNTLVVSVELKPFNPRQGVPKATFGINDAIREAKKKYGNRLQEPVSVVSTTSLDNRPQPGRANLTGTFRLQMKPKQTRSRRTTTTKKSAKTKSASTTKSE